MILDSGLLFFGSPCRSRCCNRQLTKNGAELQINPDPTQNSPNQALKGKYIRNNTEPNWPRPPPANFYQVSVNASNSTIDHHAYGNVKNLSHALSKTEDNHIITELNNILQLVTDWVRYTTLWPSFQSALIRLFEYLVVAYFFGGLPVYRSSHSYRLRTFSPLVLL